MKALLLLMAACGGSGSEGRDDNECSATLSGALTATQRCKTDGDSTVQVGTGQTWNISVETDDVTFIGSYALPGDYAVGTYTGDTSDTNNCIATAMLKSGSGGQWMARSQAAGTLMVQGSCSITFTTAIKDAVGVRVTYEVHGHYDATLLRASDNSMLNVRVDF